MTDLGGWKRKLHPRSKTPTADEERLTEPSTVTRTRPKIPSFLSFSGHDQNPSSPDNVVADQWSIDKPPPPRDENIDIMTQSIMSTLMANMHKGLPVTFNSNIMQLVAAYGSAIKEVRQLKEKIGNLERSQETFSRELNASAQSQRNRDSMVPAPASSASPAAFEHNSMQSHRNNDGLARRRAQTASSLTGRETRGSFLANLATAQTGQTRPVTDLLPSIEQTLESQGAPKAESISSSFSSNGDLLRDEIGDGITNTQPVQISPQPELQAIATLAELMAERRGVEVEEAVGVLINVYFAEDLSPITGLDGSGTANGSYSSAEEAKNLVLSRLAMDGLTEAPKVRQKLSLDTRTDTGIGTGNPTAQKRHRLEQRPFSFSAGDDLPSQLAGKGVVTTETPLPSSTVTPALVDVQHSQHSASGAPSGGLQRQSPARTARPPVFKQSSNVSATQIPSPRSSSKRVTPTRLRQGSLSFGLIPATGHSTHPNEKNIDNSSTEKARRPSVGTHATSRSQTGRLNSSETVNSAGRRSAASRASREGSHEAGDARRTSDIAIAAAKVAEERAEERMPHSLNDAPFK